MSTTTPYLKIIGCLMWIASTTRPDVCYAVRYLSRYSAKPTEAHLVLAKRVMAYLLCTKDHGLVLGGKPHKLEGWVDADHSGCLNTRKSTTGYVYKFCNSTIQWQSRRQATISLSTMESEYVATAEAAREAIWLRSLLSELGFKQNTTTINCDNQSAIRLANNPGTHARSKHIDIKHHFIREKVFEGDLRLEYVRSEMQDADFLTKSLSRDAHSQNCERIKLEPLNNASISLFIALESTMDARITNRDYILEHGITATWEHSCERCLPAILANGTVRDRIDCVYLEGDDPRARSLTKCATCTREGQTCYVNDQNISNGQPRTVEAKFTVIRTPEEYERAKAQPKNERKRECTNNGSNKLNDTNGSNEPNNGTNKSNIRSAINKLIEVQAILEPYKLPKMQAQIAKYEAKLAMHERKLEARKNNEHDLHATSSSHAST